MSTTPKRSRVYTDEEFHLLPQPMVDAVHYLRRIFSLEPEAMLEMFRVLIAPVNTTLASPTEPMTVCEFDHEVELTEDTKLHAALLQSSGPVFCMTPFGLLAGMVNKPPLLLYYEWVYSDNSADGDQPIGLKFGIYEAMSEEESHETLPAQDHQARLSHQLRS